MLLLFKYEGYKLSLCTHSNFQLNPLILCAGVVISFRKEGRSLSEVAKYLVYSTCKRQEGGDSAEKYPNCAEQVAGVQDTRFQALAPDPLHFLGVNRLHDFISMSDMKYNAIVNTGIKIIYCVEIPKDLVNAGAQVEIATNVFHGYNAGKACEGIGEKDLRKTVGREYTEHHVMFNTTYKCRTK